VTQTARWLPIAVAGALAVSACGGGADDGSEEQPPRSESAGAVAVKQASVPDPCALLTVAEIAAAMGEATATAHARPAPAAEGDEAKMCNWDGPKPAAGKLEMPKAIALTVWRGKEYYAPEKRDIDVHPVSGLGDKAALTGSKGIMWLQGDMTLQLQFVSLSDAEPRAQLESLARKAAARIG
jgi:hypothetical protein